MNVLFVSPLYRNSCADDLENILLLAGVMYFAVMMFAGVLALAKGYPLPYRFAIAFTAILCVIFGTATFLRTYFPMTIGVSYDASAIHVRQCRMLQLESSSYPRNTIAVTAKFVHESRQRPKEPYLVFTRQGNPEEVALIPLRNSGANLPLLKVFAPGPLAQLGIR